MSATAPKYTNYPPYTPITSLGRELGIMFAFLGACLVTMLVYSLVWRAHQKRTHAQDLTRRKALRARTVLHKHPATLGTAPTAGTVAAGSVDGRGDRVHEKMMDRFAMPVDRVELPVHGGTVGTSLMAMERERERERSRSRVREIGNGNGRGIGGSGDLL